HFYLQERDSSRGPAITPYEFFLTTSSILGSQVSAASSLDQSPPPSALPSRQEVSRSYSRAFSAFRSSRVLRASECARLPRDLEVLYHTRYERPPIPPPAEGGMLHDGLFGRT